MSLLSILPVASFKPKLFH